MPIECAYSFKDLYKAAFSQEISEEKWVQFGKISQDERNKLVRRWAQKAGWEIKDKPGTDGLTYTAFCPRFDY